MINERMDATMTTTTITAGTIVTTTDGRTMRAIVDADRETGSVWAIMTDDVYRDAIVTPAEIDTVN